MTREGNLEPNKSRQWCHSIEIAPGLVTPGAHPLGETRQVVEHVKLPASPEGPSVLDVGARDVFLGFEAGRRRPRSDVEPSDLSGVGTR